MQRSEITFYQDIYYAQLFFFELILSVEILNFIYCFLYGYSVSLEVADTNFLGILLEILSGYICKFKDFLPIFIAVLSS